VCAEVFYRVYIKWENAKNNLLGVRRYTPILVLSDSFFHSFIQSSHSDLHYTATQWVITIRISNHPSEFHRRKVPPPFRFIFIIVLVHILVLFFLRLSAGGLRKGRISTAGIPAAGIPASRISPAARISPTASLSPTRLSSAALPRPGLPSAALRSSIRSASAPAATKFTELWLFGRLVRLSLSLSISLISIAESDPIRLFPSWLGDRCRRNVRHN